MGALTKKHRTRQQVPQKNKTTPRSPPQPITTTTARRAHIEAAGRPVRYQGVLRLHHSVQHAHLRLHLPRYVLVALLVHGAPKGVQALTQRDARNGTRVAGGHNREEKKQRRERERERERERHKQKERNS